MVAIGDRGAQIPLEQVPLAQQKIVEMCRQLNKPVIVASQLLESMIEYPTPTSAEVADVSEAVRQLLCCLFDDFAANNLEVDALFVYTKNGYMASLLSCNRPDCPIFAFTGDTSVRRRLNLQCGLIPFSLY
ncbi:hypothetical protein L1987_06912 [Smallanthus sonchifolius]|uniref:Uncharacterized protein n=1 Tax=Smallanthus sonchifolius TaxID=185202 RepID=A0ACB9JZP8_9ASTR|nr:hypothetical protein L1987_06912 [Smallanthus sonchifolius]